MRLVLGKLLAISHLSKFPNFFTLRGIETTFTAISVDMYNSNNVVKATF